MSIAIETTTIHMKLSLTPREDASLLVEHYVGVSPTPVRRASLFGGSKPRKLGVQRSDGVGSALPESGAKRDRRRWRWH
jgi:hypothetical protein